MIKVTMLPKLPDYYVYKKDGRWYKTDDALTKRISARIFALKTLELPKMIFYPNWNNEGPQGAKYTAWRVNMDGEQVARWYWKVKEHSKKCKGRCISLGDGRCATKAIAMLEWSPASRCWVLAPMEGKASDEEAKILDEK